MSFVNKIKYETEEIKLGTTSGTTDFTGDAWENDRIALSP